MTSTFNAIIIEDDATSRLLLKDLLESTGRFNVLADFENPLDGLKELPKHSIDVLFLDVEMPEMSGIELAKYLPKETKVVITTSQQKYALDAFGIHAFDFILKPVYQGKILKVIERLEASPEKVEKPIFLKTKEGYIRIILDDIIVISAFGDYLHYITEGKKYLVRQTFKHAQDIVRSLNFVQVHRSHIVNLEKVISFTFEEIVLPENTIPMSRGFKEHFLDQINKIV